MRLSPTIMYIYSEIYYASSEYIFLSCSIKIYEESTKIKPLYRSPLIKKKYFFLLLHQQELIDH